MVQELETQYDLQLNEQIGKIEAIPGHFDLFHPVFPNNFSLISVNNEVDLKQNKSEVAEAMRQLNVANFNFHRFCTLQAAKLKWENEALKAQVDSMLLQWKKLIDAGNSFLSVDFAESVVAGFQVEGYPILDVLNRDRFNVIIQAFLDLEFRFKSFFKLSVFVGFDKAYDRLAVINEYFVSNPDLFSSIERIEVAKEHFPMDKKVSPVPFPAFSIFFNRGDIHDLDHPALKETIDHLRADTNDGSLPKAAEYTDLIAPGITLSQGYKLYKKFLAIIGVIDKVYDQRTRYAYLVR